MVSGKTRFCDRGLSICVKTGEQQAGFHLRTGNRRIIMDSMKLRRGNIKRGTSIAENTGNMCAHLCQWFNDSFHWAGVQWFISGQFRVQNGCPARIPEISLVVVPLFPTSRIFSGALSPCNPFPCTITEE